MRSPTAPAFDFLMMALAVVIVVVIPSTQAFLYPTRVGGAASTRRCPSHHLCQQRPVVSQRSCVSSKVALSMLSEENGAMTEVPDTEVNDLMEKAKAAQASIARPSLPVVIGPVMQPKEQKKKQEQDAAASSEPKNQWASGAFKRGLALQVCCSFCCQFYCIVLYCVMVKCQQCLSRGRGGLAIWAHPFFAVICEGGKGCATWRRLPMSPPGARCGAKTPCVHVSKRCALAMYSAVLT